MKAIASVAVAAALVAGVAATSHNHGHNHQHFHRQAKEIVKRDQVIVTEVVEGPTVTEYVLEGKPVTEKDAKEGLRKGIYVIKGESKPSFIKPPPSVSTSISTPKGGQFYEHKSSSAPPSSAPSAAPEPVGPPAGIDVDFPSGKIPCSKLPTEYGAMPISWAAHGGWTTLMEVGHWSKNLHAAFDNIVQPKDKGCSPGCMCSYACPPGFQKCQWPENTQGATGQSIGGLYCNDQGFLELTRPECTKLCEPGAGGIFVRNELSSNAAVCRTDYPGNEEMNIPVNTQPGQTYPLTNPVSARYYKWQGKRTTAQYYANNEGVPVEEACTWKSQRWPDSAGNWAPTNIGVGKADDGVTYLSIFPNLPTSNAVLNYDIELEGDFNGECYLRSGVYAQSPTGCTVGVPEGGTATIVFKKSGSRKA